MIFVCYPKCSTCQKAKKWLDVVGYNITESPTSNNKTNKIVVDLPLFFLMESSLMPADRDRQDKGKNKFKN